MNKQPAVSQTTSNLMVFLCVMAAFCEGIDLQAAGIAAGGIVAEFKPIAGQMGSFFSASTFGLFIGALIGGRLSDRFGRKVVLVTSITAFGVFTLFTALSWNMTSLTWTRVLTGVGLGGALPNLLALVSESSAESRRNANVALVYSGMPFGGGLVSAFSLVSVASHWRWIFIVGGLVPLIVAPIMARHLKESAAFTHARATLASAPRSAGVARAGSFLAVVAEGRALLSALLWLSIFLGLIVLYLLINWLPTLMKDNGFNPSEVAIVQIGFNIGGGVAALVIGRLLEGVWRRPSVIAAAVALPMLLVWLANAPAQLAVAAGIVLLLGCAVLAIQAFLYAVAPGCYPTLIRGVGVGVAVAIGRIGSIVGPKWGGVLKDAGYNSSQLLMTLVPIAVFASLCAIILLWRAPKAATDNTATIIH